MPSDGEVLALEIWGVGITGTPSLPLFPGPLWSVVVVPDKVQSMVWIEQTVCKQMTDVKLWLLYSNTWNQINCVQKRPQARLRMLSIKCVHKSYLYVKTGFGIK